MTVAELAAAEPFGAPPAHGLFRSTRRRRDGELNLKSVGLLDARVADLHRRTLRSIDPVDVLTYPPLHALRAQLATWFDVDDAAVVLAPGSDPGLNCLVRAFPDARRILGHTPDFEGWDKYARIAGRAPERVPADPATGRFRIADLLRRIGTGPPPLVVLTVPNGFTGEVADAADVARLAAAVARCGGLLVLDTAYLAFTSGGERIVHDLRSERHVVRVNSFSKSHGLSGSRIAALVSHPDTIRHVLDVDPEAGVAAPAVALLGAALRERTLFEQVWRDVASLRDVLAAEVARVLPRWRARVGGANFVAWDVPDAADAAAAARHLDARRIVVRTFDLAGVAGIRIGIGDRGTVSRVVEALGEWAAGR